MRSESLVVADRQGVDQMILMRTGARGASHSQPTLPRQGIRFLTGKAGSAHHNSVDRPTAYMFDSVQRFWPAL